MRVRDLVHGNFSIIQLSQSIFLINAFLSDAELEQRLDKMDDLDEFEPDEVHGLVFSEDEENMLELDDKDDW